MKIAPAGNIMDIPAEAIFICARHATEPLILNREHKKISDHHHIDPTVFV